MGLESEVTRLAAEHAEGQPFGREEGVEVIFGTNLQEMERGQGQSGWAV